MKRLIFISLWLTSLTLFGQNGEFTRKKGLAEPFVDGCCLKPEFSRPIDVSQATVGRQRLFEALHCATNNRFIGGTDNLAKSLRTNDALIVSYHYGTYMPEQEGPALTIAVYSEDRKHGILFDTFWRKDEYLVGNLPPLLRTAKQWRVGEINGGLWSYSRLWYLAQEVGSRPTKRITLTEIKKNKPKQCRVLFEDETNWQVGKGKYIGDSVRQATAK